MFSPKLRNRIYCLKTFLQAIVFVWLLQLSLNLSSLKMRKNKQVTTAYHTHRHTHTNYPIYQICYDNKSLYFFHSAYQGPTITILPKTFLPTNFSNKFFNNTCVLVSLIFLVSILEKGMNFPIPLLRVIVLSFGLVSGADKIMFMDAVKVLVFKSTCYFQGTSYN